MNMSRLDIRLPEDTKDLIQQAAELRNQTVTQFVLSTLRRRAKKIVQRNNLTVLSDRDRDMFLELLDNPPKPNKALKDAAKKYKQTYGN